MVLSKLFASRKGRHVWPKRTICEVHRMMYDIMVVSFQDKPEELKKLFGLLEEAYEMGIKINRAMVLKKCATYDWKNHEDKEELERMRKLRIHLEQEYEDCDNLRQVRPEAVGV